MSLVLPTASPPVVLVTGANGWLGRRIVKSLVDGLPDYPAVFARPAVIRTLVMAGERVDDLLAVGIEPVFGDVRDPAALAAFCKGSAGGLLIHLAGIIHPPGRSSWFDEINHRGTLLLHQAAKVAGIRRMVVMSSNSPMGANAKPTDTFTEESPYNPYMGYGKSKWRMELGLRREIERGEGPEIVIIRGPWFYGLGQPPRQSLFFTMIKDGKFPIVGSGENRRSMAYTDNLAHGIMLAAAHPEAPGQIFWIADKRPYSMNEVVATVQAVLKEDFGMTVSDRRVQLPGIVADVARVIDAAVQGAGLYHQKFHVLSEMNLTIACSIEKAERVLGYEPKVALREGMRRSIAWCIEQKIAI